MDTLESRLERLSPEQLRSVEDYIDFLLSRSAGHTGDRMSSPSVLPPVAAPPPLLTLDMPQPALSAPLSSQEPAITGPDRSLRKTEPEIPEIQEIMTEKDDTRSGGYLDYGAFESPQKAPSSPADEAVQRVKKKLDRKRDDTQADALLEWVD